MEAEIAFVCILLHIYLFAATADVGELRLTYVSGSSKQV